jgi:hypothetical protein
MPFESAPIPDRAYGFAYAYNVLEHIAAPRPFFDKLASVLARVRGRIHLPHEDTKLSKELRLLVPDMKRWRKPMSK